MQITIYTDGSAKGNPGPGGYGIVLICLTDFQEVNTKDGLIFIQD